MNITEVLPHGSHSLSWQRHFPFQTAGIHFEDVPELLEPERRRRANRQILHPVLVLSARLRLGVLAATMPLSVPKLCFANDLECIPGIVRLCEVPNPDADEAESGASVTAINCH